MPQFNHAAPRTREHIHREHEQHVKRRPAVPRQRGAVGEPHVHQDAGHLRAQRVRKTHATSDNYYVEISLKKRHVRAYAEICRVTNLGGREKPHGRALIRKSTNLQIITQGIKGMPLRRSPTTLRRRRARRPPRAAGTPDCAARAHRARGGDSGNPRCVRRCPGANRRVE